MNYTNYYSNQIGRGVRLSDFGNIYRGSLRVQRGRGIGSIFSGLFRFLKPYLFSGLNAVKDEAIRQGGEILQNIGKKPIKELLKEKGMEGLHNLTEKAISKVKTMSGSGSKRIKAKSKRKLRQSALRVVKNHLKRGKRRAKPKSKKSSSSSKKRVLDIFS